MTDAIAQHLIAGMFRDHLVAANETARLGNFPMARLELSSATETLAQLEALAAPKPDACGIGPISPIPPIEL